MPPGLIITYFLIVLFIALFTYASLHVGFNCYRIIVTKNPSLLRQYLSWLYLILLMFVFFAVILWWVWRFLAYIA